MLGETPECHRFAQCAAHYGIASGKPADLVLLGAADPALAVAEIVVPLWCMRGGWQTFTRPRPTLHKTGGMKHDYASRG